MTMSHLPPRATTRYKILMRKNETGETRIIEQDGKYWPDDIFSESLFCHWANGNGSCDCNRASEFARAAKENDDQDWPCGHTAYTVIHAELSNGTVIPIDEQKTEGKQL